MKTLAIIPARMASSRFPGKPMKKILGIPMIGHCYLRSIMSNSLNECYVATPDQEIFDYIHSINGKAIMTSHKHEMCNERVFEAVDNIEDLIKLKFELIVNIQGDLPMVFPSMIDDLIKPIKNDNLVTNTTMVDDIISNDDFEDKNRVKVLMDKNDNAILFTREPVPSQFKYKQNFNKYKHVAIRAYRRDLFDKIKDLSMTPIEKIEGIDDLRLIENDIKIRITYTKKITETVDTQEDLEKVISMMKEDKLIEEYKEN
tara:strand:+ start:253 stop:1026 length:774 start_codon:yes stop_codon:yes gene_type:complete